MKNRFFLLLANTILLINYFLFFCFKYSLVSKILSRSSKDVDFFDVSSWLVHELAILSVGLLSIVGIIFYSRSRIFFLTSIAFLSTQLVIAILAPSLSIIYIIKALSILIFLYLAVFKNSVPVYENRRNFKLASLIIFSVFYLVVLWYLKIFKL